MALAFYHRRLVWIGYFSRVHPIKYFHSIFFLLFQEIKIVGTVHRNFLIPNSFPVYFCWTSWKHLVFKLLRPSGQMESHSTTEFFLENSKKLSQTIRYLHFVFLHVNVFTKRTLLWASVCRITFRNNVFPIGCFDMVTPDGMRHMWVKHRQKRSWENKNKTVRTEHKQLTSLRNHECINYSSAHLLAS